MQRRIDSNRNNFTPSVIAYRKSISGESIRLCKRRFATNWANRLESSKNSHPSYCLLRIDFQGNDSTLQETFPTNRVASLSASPNRPKFVATFLERQTFISQVSTSGGADQLPTSFPGSLILPPPGSSEGGGKMRDPGNEVGGLRLNRVESLSTSHESTQVCRHVSRTSNAYVSLFHGS